MRPLVRQSPWCFLQRGRPWQSHCWCVHHVPSATHSTRAHRPVCHATDAWATLQREARDALCGLPLRVGLDVEERCGPNPSEYNSVREWHDATVLYCSRGELDVAILQLKTKRAAECGSGARQRQRSTFPFMRLRNIQPTPEGSRVYALGHSQFRPQTEMLPTLFAGHIARRAWHHGDVAILQVGCARACVWPEWWMCMTGDTCRRRRQMYSRDILVACC